MYLFTIAIIIILIIISLYSFSKGMIGSGIIWLAIAISLLVDYNSDGGIYVAGVRINRT